MLYGTESKKMRLEELIATYSDKNFGSQNRDNGGIDGLRKALDRLEHDEDIIEKMSKNEDANAKDSQFPAVIAAVPKAITFDFLDSYRKAGLFDKLHNISVLSQ
jgi:hypothetical protein